MDTPETRYVDIGGANVAYNVTGGHSMNLLALMSGNLPIAAMTEPLLAPFVERLASFSRLICFDRRGVGMSDPIPGGGEWTLEHWVDEAIGVLDTTGVRKSAVIALDTATSPVAVTFAAAHPDRVSALVLIWPNARPRAAADFPWGMSRQDADRYPQMSVEAVMAGRLSAAALAADPNMTRAVADWIIRWRRMGAIPASFLAAVQAWVEVDVRALLPLVQAPTLVLQRGDTRTLITSPDHSRFVADHIPRARYVELPGGSPYIFLGDTKPVLDEIEEFLTGVRPLPESDRVLATVLMTDIVESTSQTASVGDRAWRDLLNRHDAIVRGELDRHRGKKVNSIGLGDGVLATFDGPARACRCASALHESIGSSLGIDVRAGLHTGEIELRGDDVTGMAVNIAARVMKLAHANETLVSRTVTDLVAGSGLEFEERGEHELRGVPGKWAIYAVKT